ncbi:MAG: TIGR03905 family TSCPD domain-containing protein [Lachnospiraceae bacterium]|nr:TIGR03905 family TSCPD domain-containing protein [Lachnospiraceae bacterium]
MSEYSIATQGTCSTQIDFTIDEEGKLHNVVFHGGCPGNTRAVAKLLEGYDAQAAVDILKGNPCGMRGTSCADQLARGVEKALAER